MSDLATNRWAPAGRSLPARLPAFCLMLCLACGNAWAEWTGVAFEIADTRSDWDLDNGTREAKITSLLLQIEERTATGFTVGGGIGYMTMRVDGNDRVDTKKFDGEFLQVYFRQEFALGESLTLDAMLDYNLYRGDENDSDDRDDIDWNQLGIELGASIQPGNVRYTPFVSYTNIDGDISGSDPTESFSLEDEYGYGLRLDFFTESTAFIRLKLMGGSHTGGFLTFVRRYE